MNLIKTVNLILLPCLLKGKITLRTKVLVHYLLSLFH